MRLTNVSQMDLVGGRVSSYAVRLSHDPGRALPVSFDQGQHIGAGERPGSWMAIAFRLPVDAAGSARSVAGDVAAAWQAVVARHGALRTAFSQGGSGELMLHEAAVLPGEWVAHEARPGQRTREIVREVFDEQCRSFQRPSHGLCLVEPRPNVDDPRPEVVIGSDHAHVDMWSLVILARDLLACVDDLRAGRAPGSDLAEVPGFAEHTALLALMPPAPAGVQNRWSEILEAGGGMMPTFPLPLGKLDPLPAEVVEVRDVLDAAQTEQLAALARERGVRMIGLGMSVLTEVTGALAEKPLRAVFPVHSRHDPWWREAVGWFITNAVIESADPDPAACVAAVQEATGLGSWPLAPILAPYGGMPAGPGMFAVSWLDARRLPVPSADPSEVKYVSAAIRTDGVMIWFAVNDSGLHLRCRYPDTPEARDNVGRWLDAVELGLRELAAHELTA